MIITAKVMAMEVDGRITETNRLEGEVTSTIIIETSIDQIITILEVVLPTQRNLHLVGEHPQLRIHLEEVPGDLLSQLIRDQAGGEMQTLWQVAVQTLAKLF